MASWVHLLVYRTCHSISKKYDIVTWGKNRKEDKTTRTICNTSQGRSKITLQCKKHNNKRILDKKYHCFNFVFLCLTVLIVELRKCQLGKSSFCKWTWVAFDNINMETLEMSEHVHYSHSYQSLTCCNANWSCSQLCFNQNMVFIHDSIETAISFKHITTFEIPMAL